jgi:HK97 gp10 family phage protein
VVAVAVRVVLVPDADGRVDAGPLLRDLADDVADVMRDLAPVDTGDMRSTIRVLDVTANNARIGAGGIPGAVTGNLVDYVVYVERGTSKMSAQPFMRPALYRYRAGVR